jgi:hypothetical protein
MSLVLNNRLPLSISSVAASAQVARHERDGDVEMRALYKG